MADKNNPNLANARDGPKQISVTKHCQDTKRDLLQPRDGKNRSPRVRKRKRRFDPTEKLPTPPPDPHDMEKTTGERSPKRKSLDEDKENKDVQQDDHPQTPTSRRVSAEVTSPAAQAFTAAFSGTDEAFEHLEKLHSLMEQILELRVKNAKLFRRVRDLERLKALRRLESSTKRTFLQGYMDPLFPEQDVDFAESLLSSMLESSASSSSNQSTAVTTTTPNQEVTRVRSFRAPMARQRSRSIGTESRPSLLPSSAKRSSCHLQYNSGSSCGSGPLTKSGKRNSLAGSLGMAPPKVSKWTKVKAAFKWEKAGIGTGGSNTTLSNVMAEAMDHETTRFLRLPEGPDNATTITTPSGSSPRTAEHSGPPSPGTLSSSSSTDDIYNGLFKRIHTARSNTRDTDEDPTRRRSFDGELIIPHNIQYATQLSRDSTNRRLEKGHKTPWGMVKDIIQSRRDSSVRRPLPRGSIRSEDGYSLSSLESSDMIHEILTSEHSSVSKPRVQITSSEGPLPTPIMPKPSSSPTQSSEIVDLASRRLTPTLTITVPSSEELRSVSSPESTSPPTSSHHRHQLDSNSTDEGRSPSEEPDSTSSPKNRSSCGSSVTGGGTSSATFALKERRRSANAAAITIGLGSTGERQQPVPPPRLQRQDSKWNKVKRAFLTGASSVPPSPNRISSFFDETDGGGSYSASAEDLDNNGGVSPTTQIDIQRNYQLLHDKLSVEFYRKLTEWEKLKSNGHNQHQHQSSRGTSATSPKDKDSANALLMGEEQLTPEFKKKLQEWKRMKRSPPQLPTATTSPEHQLFRRRLTDWQIWRTTPTKSEGKSTDAADSGKTHLSEDFLKKMEEWKKIKSARSDEEQSASGRRDSGETIYQARNVGQRWKTLDEKEFQPLDKVISMIEREQQRVEKHREKLLDKTSRLSELSRVVDSPSAKRDVLVHTSTGFYRFEGISEEFTRKLYEWEKSQGIAPESSTFQLLNPAYRIYADDKNTESNCEKGPRNLKRSKSMGSVVENSLRADTPIRQPSSLSLNDVANLENEAKLRIDSKQTIGEEEMSEELALDDSEPEAVIVDIEDVIEETASPMAKLQPQQTPVYCVTASETTSIAIPLGTVTAGHEPSPVILIQAGETHHRVRKHCRFQQLYGENIQTESSLETHSDNIQPTTQIDTCESSDAVNDENRKRIFEPNDINICETIIEEEGPSSHIGEESNSEAELSNIAKAADNANVESPEEAKEHESTASNLTTATAEIEPINATPVENEDDEAKSSVTESSCDAAKKVFKTLLAQASETLEDGSTEDVKDADERNNDDRPANNPVPEEVRRDVKVDDVVITVSSDIRQKKVLKTRRLTDTQVGYKWRQSSQKIEETSPEPADSLTVSTYPETPSVERIIINESTLNKIVVPTASNEQISTLSVTCEPKKSHINDNSIASENGDHVYYKRLNHKSDTKSVFVKTKRIIFSPFSRRSSNSKDKTTTTSQQQKDDPVERVEPPVKAPSHNDPPVPAVIKSISVGNSPAFLAQTHLASIQRSRSSSECPVGCERRPPLPQSPILSRKEYNHRRSSPKETAPSIRMMIQRYNQKLQEDAGSPASSGSGSPIWRSPTSERRVRTQMERYQEEVRRAIAGSSARNAADLERRRQLEKSASAGVIQPRTTSAEASRTRSPRGEILKSTSADFARNPDFAKQGSTNGSRMEDGVSSEVGSNRSSCAPSERRKNSLQNKSPEIFSNIRQSLVQEYKTLPIKGESMEDKSASGSRESSFFERDRSTTSRESEVREDDSRMSGNISPELLHKLNALSTVSQKHSSSRYCTTMASYETSQTSAISENSTPLRVRAQRIKKAKDDFFSRGPSCHSHDPSMSEAYRHSQHSSSTMGMMTMDLAGGAGKSASAGMINVDPRTYERLAPSTRDPFVQPSTTRTEKNSGSAGGGGSGADGGTLSKLASKFRRAKLRRTGNRDGREKEAGKTMSTVSMLCRQSLLVDIQPEELSKSCPTSPSPQRDDEHEVHAGRFKQHRDSN